MLLCLCGPSGLAGIPSALEGVCTAFKVVGMASGWYGKWLVWQELAYNSHSCDGIQTAHLRSSCVLSLLACLLI
jgi:hypothetical protein